MTRREVDRFIAKAGCYQPDAEHDLNASFSLRSGRSAITGCFTMRVLVVEDEARLSEQLAAALQGAGYAVDVASDGARADFLARTRQYDVVVLDLGLPKIDGLTLLRQWRESGLSAPVLILTARGSWHEKVQGMDTGADDYVAKPFRMEELLARLRALIRRSSGQVSPEL